MKLTARNITIFVLSLICVVGITYSVRLTACFKDPGVQQTILILLNLLNGSVALVAMKLTGMPFHLDLRNKSQYGIGCAIAATLSLLIAVIPALFGTSLIGGRAEFSLSLLIRDFCFYLLVIGPVEELVFRVYIQDVLTCLFSRQKWIGVTLGALLFGLWHIINGNFVQVLFTFVIGLIFGFAKYLIRNCGYPGLALGHGLYDFFNTVVRMFLI